MSDTLRLQLSQRANQSCEYCRIREVQDLYSVFHAEHVRARQHGGTDQIENRAWSCSHCNSHKGPNLTGIDPVTDSITRLFNPRSDVWDEHFEMVNGEIEGLTDIGRATLRTLSMNQRDRVEARRE